MKAQAETGTDVAELAIGDLATIDDLTIASEHEWQAARARLTSEGCLWIANVGSDGAYLVELWVDEDPPAERQRFLLDPVTIEKFHAPSGRLFVTGSEYYCPKPDFQKALGSVVEIPAGTYSFVAYRTDYSEDGDDDPAEKRMLAAVTAEQARAWKIGNSLSGYAVLGTLLLLVLSAFLFKMSIFLAGAAWLGIAALWYGQRAYGRRPDFVAAERLHKQYSYEYPSIVVVLKRVADVPRRGR